MSFTVFRLQLLYVTILVTFFGVILLLLSDGANRLELKVGRITEVFNECCGY